MPLAHSLPDARILASPSATHDPAAGLPVVPCGDAPFADGVCFYLGPLRRRYRGPSKFPVLGYLFAATIEEPSWFAFPCDVGGWLRRPDANAAGDAAATAELTMRDGSWRKYLAGLLEHGFPDDWSGYLTFTGPAPARSALPAGLHPSIVADDPLTWTPEVRSPDPVSIDGHTVAVTFVTLPVVSADRHRDDELSKAIGGLREVLLARGIPVQSVARIGAERYDEALHRVSETWIKGASR
jgi:hypothetical protein